MSGQGSLPTGGGYAGPEWLQTGGNQFNAISFVVRQIIAGKTFGAMVEVVAVHGGGIGGPGVVDVRPLVNQIDGLGNQIPHGTIYGMPWFRLQAGANAVICDPQVGDKGAALICDRDISIVKATGAVSGPGSWRQNSWSDGLYFGAFLGGAATQYVEFATGGINVVSPTKITLQAPLVEIDGLLQQGTGATSYGATLQGPVTVVNDLTAEGTDVHTHVHSGVQPGGGDTGPPV
jgi:hypothetical protein